MRNASPSLWLDGIGKDGDEEKVTSREGGREDATRGIFGGGGAEGDSNP